MSVGNHTMQILTLVPPAALVCKIQVVDRTIRFQSDVYFSFFSERRQKGLQIHRIFSIR